jgi:hypothetical protein
MQSFVDSLVESGVQDERFTSTETQVGDRALVRGLAGGSILRLGGLSLCDSLCRYPVDAVDDVGHSAAAIRPKDLDGNNIGLLGDSVCARGDGSSAVSSVTVAIFIDVILRHCPAPGSTTLEFNVMDVYPGVNNVDIDTQTTFFLVFVLGEGGEGELGTMTDTGKTLKSRGVSSRNKKKKGQNEPMEPVSVFPRW